MSNRSANILIGILAVLVLVGATMIAGNSIKRVTPTTTVFVLTTIPRSQTPLIPIVQVKVVTTTTVIHNPVHNAPYPYQDLCAFAGTHPDSGAFVENFFVWIFDNKAFDSYEEFRQVVLDLMNGDPECDEEYEKAILRGTRPHMYDEGGE